MKRHLFVAAPLSLAAIALTVGLLGINPHRTASPEAIASATPAATAPEVCPPSLHRCFDPAATGLSKADQTERKAWQLWDAARKEGTLKVDWSRPFIVEFIDVFDTPVAPVGNDVAIDDGGNRYLYYILYTDHTLTPA